MNRTLCSLLPFLLLACAPAPQGSKSASETDDNSWSLPTTPSSTNTTTTNTTNTTTATTTTTTNTTNTTTTTDSTDSTPSYTPPEWVLPLLPGSQWSYVVEEAVNSVSDSGELIVTVARVDWLDGTAELVLTGDRTYLELERYPSAITVRQTATTLERLDEGGVWRMVADLTATDWSDGLRLLAVDDDPVGTLEMDVSDPSVPAGAYLNVPTTYTSGVVQSVTFGSEGQITGGWDHTTTVLEAFDADLGVLEAYRVVDSVQTSGGAGVEQATHSCQLQGWSILQGDGVVREGGAGAHFEALASFTPGVTSGEDGMVVYDRGEAIELTFHAPMDRASVEGALVVSSDWEGTDWTGTYAWLDDQHVIFTPDAPYADGYYSVDIGGSATTVAGAAMQETGFYFFVDPNAL